MLANLTGVCVANIFKAHTERPGRILISAVTSWGGSEGHGQNNVSLTYSI